eukprot:13519031-Alexandrium_andersonii.AAC.1
MNVTLQIVASGFSRDVPEDVRKSARLASRLRPRAFAGIFLQPILAQGWFANAEVQRRPHRVAPTAV